MGTSFNVKAEKQDSENDQMNAFHFFPSRCLTANNHSALKIFASFCWHSSLTALTSINLKLINHTVPHFACNPMQLS